MDILRIRHSWPEPSGFFIHHRGKRDDFIFICFHTPVSLIIEGKECDLKPNACVIFDKETDFSFKSNGNLIHDWMHFTGDVREKLFSFGLSTDEIYYPKYTDFITDIIRELEVEFFSEKSYFSEMYDALLCELFIKLARNTVLQESTEPVPDGIMKCFIELRNEIFANLSFPWTVSEMAKRVLLSESRFYVVYHDIFGLSPKNDLICARMELAKNLLRQGTHSVDEVALLSGYSGTFNFIKQFKKYTGITPGAYKHSNKS